MDRVEDPVEDPLLRLRLLLLLDSVWSESVSLLRVVARVNFDRELFDRNVTLFCRSLCRELVCELSLLKVVMLLEVSSSLRAGIFEIFLSFNRNV